jgi:hypothetical protein
LVGKQDDACYTNANSSPDVGMVLPSLTQDGCNGDKGGGQVKAEATKSAITKTTRVASNEDGTGNSGKSNGNGEEGAGRATMRAMAAATTVAAMRVASNEEDEGAGQATTRVMAAATTVVAMRVASDKEGKGFEAMEMVTRLAGEQRRRRRRG